MSLLLKYDFPRAGNPTYVVSFGLALPWRLTIATTILASE
mgnify:FL=1|jgi:hypothetical protein